ncbi:MAG: hypothetical protein AAB368_02390, partial [bacterium]
AAAGLAAVFWLAGCAAKSENAVTVVNRWSKSCTVSLHEASAAAYQFIDLTTGQNAGFAKLPKGAYDIAFCLDGICKRDASGRTVDPKTGSFENAVVRRVTFTGCCGTKSYVVQADGSVSE